MKRLEGVWLFCVREWKFLACFVLAAYLVIALAGFLDRSQLTVRACVGMPGPFCR